MYIQPLQSHLQLCGLDELDDDEYFIKKKELQKQAIKHIMPLVDKLKQSVRSIFPNSTFFIFDVQEESEDIFHADLQLTQIYLDSQISGEEDQILADKILYQINDPFTKITETLNQLIRKGITEQQRQFKVTKLFERCEEILNTDLVEASLASQMAEIRQQAIDQARKIVFSIFDVLMKIIDDETFIPSIQKVANDFFSIKNLFRRKTPQNLTEYLIDKFFNTQKVFSYEEFMQKGKEWEQKFMQLTSFQKILLEIKDPQITNSKCLGVILSSFPEYVAEIAFKNYYQDKHLLTYKECLHSQFKVIIIKNAQMSPYFSSTMNWKSSQQSK